MPKTPTANIHSTQIQKHLLDWYDQYKRDLPWRRTKDSYAIFVSEMMLQQTQVKTVIPYYGRFLDELPDWQSLAKAKEEKILKLWEGLGYYRRARNLQAAAQKIIAEFNGKLPQTREEIIKLPGVGQYSAGAVLSIAFQKPEPLVDGNVIRVFSRLFVLRGNLKTGENHEKVWDIARSLISTKRPGDFNQALMELGATVCFTDNPQCLLCPLFQFCEAAQRGIQADLPEMPKAAKNIEVPMAALLLENKKKILVRKRDESEKWLKGFWEFPSAEGKSMDEARQKLEKEFKVKTERKPAKDVKHQITNHKIHLSLFTTPIQKPVKTTSHLKWVTAVELEELPFSSAQGKLRQWVLKKFIQKK
ncbi:MAG TPA: A/G-specific adenine glycosylase [bacterium]|jgi:A/G-specific adenine glycosylase|nr:A/G-specific adenine glycosylase [bacterium]